jgi:hypothetical protein
MYSADAGAARGAQIRPMTWSPPAALTVPSETVSKDRATWVYAQVAPVLDGVATDGGAPLLIGKSLGSYCATLAAERQIPAVWLTPVLTDQAVLEGLRQATAPCLLVGGTADHAWDGAVARKLSPHILEVDGADHGMYVPGPLAASAAVLGQVVTAVESFLDEIVWHAAWPR